MSLFLFGEKSQPKLTSVETSFSRSGQIFPVYQLVLRWGLGFSGLFNFCCAPALASSATITSQDATQAIAPTALEPLTSLLYESALSTSTPHSRTPQSPLPVSDSYNPLGAFSGSGHALYSPGSEATLSESSLSEVSNSLKPSENHAAESDEFAAQQTHSSPNESFSESPNESLNPSSHPTNAIPFEAHLARLLRPVELAIAPEDNSQPQFLIPCERLDCKDKVADPIPQKTIAAPVLAPSVLAPSVLAQSADLVELLNDPALDHVGSATISLERRLNHQTTMPTDGLSGDAQSDASSFSEVSQSLENNRSVPATMAQSSDSMKTFLAEEISQTSTQTDNPPDEELGELRLQVQRSREKDELGILRLLQTAQSAPPAPKQPIAFLSGQLGFFDTDNSFRSNSEQLQEDGTFLSLSRRDEQIFQAGLAFYFLPQLSDNTSLYIIAETGLARYEKINKADYNQVQVQLGIRQRIFPQTYAQIGWRNQQLYTRGYRTKLFGVQYIDAQLSHRSIFNAKTWLDSFYQARLGFADVDNASRFRQTLTLTLNYAVNQDIRTSLLYQIDFDDYTQISRHDTYQQVIGSLSYRLTPESRLSVFGGTRFGRSSGVDVNLDDTFYGAGLNVSVPLF